MAFPTSPTNGQQVTVNGVLYTYSSALTAWTVTSSGGSITTATAISATGNITGGNIATSGQLISSASTGTAPMVVSSTTKVANLNVEQVDGYHADTANTISTIVVRDSASNIAAANFNGTGVNVTGNITGGNINTGAQVVATGNITGGNINTGAQVVATGNITGANVNGFLVGSAGTTALPPIRLTAGSLLTNAAAGAIEFDANALYATENTTSGRGEIGILNQFRLTANGGAIGPGIADFFGSNSSINLEAGSYYELDCMAYFLKSTAGTVTFTWTNSSAVTMIRSYYVGTVATGFTTTTVTGTPVTGMATQQTSTAMAHAATGSLTSAVFHHYHFKVHVITNLATNLRLRVTSSAGTVTPQAGSYYAIRKISATAGSFAA
jgi:hypothetical protein